MRFTPGGRRRLSAGAVASLALAATVAVLAGVAKAQPPPLEGTGPFTAYGQVVQVRPSAVLLSLGDGSWIALNAGPSTQVYGPEGRPDGHRFVSLQAGEWVWAAYQVATVGATAEMVALWVRPAGPSAFAGVPVRLSGVVVAVTAAGFLLRGPRGAVWVAVVPWTVVRVGNLPSSLSLLQPGDRAMVLGVQVGATVTARQVVYQVGSQGEGRAGQGEGSGGGKGHGRGQGGDSG